jgi:PilZ domain
MDERRKVDRVKVSLRVMCESAQATLQGEITDLSVHGCFILADDKVDTGESINLKISQPQSGHLLIRGKVIYQMPEIGFGVLFTSEEDEDRKRLRWIVRAELQRALQR